MNSPGMLGVLHPGAMGVSLGQSAIAAGVAVGWCRAGRSDASHERANHAGLVTFATLEALADNCTALISVCPPSAALELAQSVAATGFNGVYVDANAISPQTTSRIAAMFRQTSATFVDGAIIGPPVRSAGSTRLYLAGGAAPRIAECFTGSALQTVTLNADVGAASALKMAYAAWTKGSAALLMATARLAEVHRVENALHDEWALSQPQLSEQLARQMTNMAPKAWRFVGEMEEIAATFADSDLPDGFHLAAADIFQALAAQQYSDPRTDVSQV